MKVYGIKNCDTVKKARRFLDENNADYEFIDLKTTELTATQLKKWLDNPQLINTRGTTYRQLKDTVLACKDQPELIKLIQANPTLLKRPIIEYDGEVLVGFDETVYRERLLD